MVQTMDSTGLPRVVPGVIDKTVPMPSALCAVKSELTFRGYAQLRFEEVAAKFQLPPRLLPSPSPPATAAATDTCDHTGAHPTPCPPPAVAVTSGANRGSSHSATATRDAHGESQHKRRKRGRPSDSSGVRDPAAVSQCSPPACVDNVRSVSSTPARVATPATNSSSTRGSKRIRRVSRC